MGRAHKRRKKEKGVDGLRALGRVDGRREAWGTSSFVEGGSQKVGLVGENGRCACDERRE